MLKFNKLVKYNLLNFSLKKYTKAIFNQQKLRC